MRKEKKGKDRYSMKDVEEQYKFECAERKERVQQ